PLEFAGDPSPQLAIWQLDEALELGEFARFEHINGPVGESTQDQIHFPHSAMPGPKQELAAADVEPFARTCRSGHGSSQRQKPGRRRAGLSIAAGRRQVSQAGYLNWNNISRLPRGVVIC